MDILNEKQEKFCQNYVLYRNATGAAKAAGYSNASAHTQGHRLLQHDIVKNRIEELEKDMETTIDVISEVEDLYGKAKEKGNDNSALKALELLSKVKTVHEEEAIKTVSELEADIVRVLEALGEERASKLFLKCSFYGGGDKETGDVQAAAAQTEAEDEAINFAEESLAKLKAEKQERYNRSREGNVLR